MRCFYCNGPATVIEELGNNRIPVCHKTSCQEEFDEEEREQKKRDRDYDKWWLRSDS